MKILQSIAQQQIAKVTNSTLLTRTLEMVVCPNFVHFQIEKKNLMHYIIIKMYIVCHNWSHNCSALVFVKGGYSKLI